MFYDIVSNLSFSPAAGSQLAYYARRLKSESITRTFSVVMAVVLAGLQTAMFIAPPNAANAASKNDIIYGGFAGANPKKNLLAVYDQDKDGLGHSGYHQLFEHFGITRKDLANSTLGNINSGNHKIKSIGRETHFALDEPFQAGGNATYYLRPLYLWGDGLNYPAMIGKRAVDGKWFAVMVDCGNIAVIDDTPDKPKQPVVKRPNISVEKELIKGPSVGSKVKPGTELTYRISFKNTGTGPAKNVVVGERLSDNTEFVSETQIAVQGHTGPMSSYHGPHKAFEGEAAGYFVFWRIDQLNAGGYGHADITVKVKDSALNDASVCDRGFIDSPDQSAEYTNKLCHTVDRKKKPDNTLNPQNPTPTPDNPIEQPVTPTVENTPPPTGESKLTTAKSAIIIAAADNSKKDANGATAQPGDTIEYTLTTTNNGNVEAKGYVVQENLNDVLEYASIIDPRGGVLDESSGIMSWPKADIKPGSDFIVTFQTRVKNPLPTTPRSASDPQSFDLKMDNVYGNLISVNLAVPAEKQVEVASANLPQTGPGTSALIVFVLLAGVIYFFYRNRQLATEIAMLKGDHYGGGK
ncbi:MAG TPA: DUF11 domain-containing protein [Candidatus Saccharimonadales bacterium]|nr:DUF11 domain-containing protein [Candidatus Saccharimonadales bacterium]